MDNEKQSGPVESTAKETINMDISFTAIKDLRKRVDTFVNSVQLILPSREVSLCYTSLQRAFHWMGKALQEAGSITPYPNNDNTANKTIDERADHSDVSVIDFTEFPTHTERVKHFRKLLQEYIDAFKLFCSQPPQLYRCVLDYGMCLQQSKVSVLDAKMWLGWELGRIRDNNKAKTPPIQLPL